MERLRDTVTIKAPLEEVFRFYADPWNVPRLTPPDMNLRVVRADQRMRRGSHVLFATRPTLVPFELQWHFEVVHFVQNETFTDRLIKGPFQFWEHRHDFRSLGDDETEVIDTIEFDGAHGFLRTVLGVDYLIRKIEEMFAYREGVLREVLERRSSEA